MKHAAGIILAGGRSRRMGCDKALLSLPNESRQTFLERLATLLAPLCSEIVVVARDAEQAATYTPLLSFSPSLHLVTDLLPDCGPLMGLYSGLCAVSSSSAFVTAVDTPLLSSAVVRYLLSQSCEDRPLIPRVGGVPQVLTAIYPHAVIPLIEARLQEGRKDPRSLLQMGPVCFIEEDVLRTIDPQLRSFLNVNTAEDLAGL